VKDVPTSVRAHNPIHTHIMHNALGYWNRVVTSARWIYFFVRARCVILAKMNGSTCLMYSRTFCVKPFHWKWSVPLGERAADNANHGGGNR